MAIFQPQADTDPQIFVIFCCDALKSRRRTLKEGRHCFEKVALTVFLPPRILAIPSIWPAIPLLLEQNAPWRYFVPKITDLFSLLPCR
jgi:hypothetical protein